jgi:preprotein translocase subunit SecG
MFTFLIVLIAVLGIILTLVVLLQSGKGGGLAGIASGGSTTQILGARQAPDILEKATWTLGTLFIVLCILTNFAIDTEERRDSVIQERIQDRPTDFPAPQAPIAPAPSPTQPVPQDN